MPTVCHRIHWAKLRTKDGAVEQLEFLLSGMCSCQSAHLSLSLMNTTTFTNAILSDAERMRRYTDETHGVICVPSIK